MQTTTTCLTIALPVYNGEATLLNALLAIKQQIDLIDFSYEFIVSDDNSTDASLKILQSFSDSHPELNLRV